MSAYTSGILNLHIWQVTTWDALRAGQNTSTFFATESKDTKVQWLLCFEVKILSSFALQEIVEQRHKSSVIIMMCFQYKSIF